MSEDSVNYYKDFIKHMNDETSEYYVKREDFEYEQLHGYKDPTKKVNGLYIANAIINLSNLKTMTIRNDDVFLVGYPKSGWYIH